MKTAAEPKYIPTLDGWRGLAIVAVMASHACGYFFAPTGVRPSPRLHAYFSQGAIGVKIFFVLSGFLICSGLVREREDTGRINLHAFYIRRAFRILPPLLVYLTVVVALGTIGLIAVSKTEIVACLLFFRNFSGGGWYTTHFWTLALEEHFYLLFPTFLALTSKSPGRWTFALLAGATLFRTLNATGDLLSPMLEKARAENFFNELVLGAWFAILARSAVLRANFQRIPGRVLLIVVLPSLIYSIARPSQLATGLVPLVLVVTIVWTSLNPRSLLGMMLEVTALRWVGRMSYSLYLWQELFFVLDVAPDALPLGLLQRWPVAPMLVLACAACSYYLIERPSIKLGRQLAAALSVVRRGRVRTSN